LLGFYRDGGRNKKKESFFNMIGISFTDSVVFCDTLMDNIFDFKMGWEDSFIISRSYVG
jgi:hypothetical protein